jgi:cell wall-associated NlpC family hydrolase
VRRLLSLSAASLLVFQACASVQPAPRYTHSTNTSVVRELEARQRGGTTRLHQVVDSYIGVPYKWGGTTRKGMDCSAFTRATFRETYGIELPRTSKQMYQLGSNIPRQQELRPGDLVFFKNTYSGAGVSHVGVYLGSGQFAHASSSRGVTITPLSNPYFSKRYAGGRRVGR